MASDKLMNHTQGETIITKLTSIADSLDDLAAVTPAKLGMGIATCDTAASTAAKTAALANFALVEGAPVSVQFTYANTATNATLNINNTGAKPIIYKDAAIGNDVISAGDTCTFIYTTNTYKITNIDTLTGPGSGTVRQIGAENGLITDQSDNADIQTTGKIGLNLKSTTKHANSVGNPEDTDQIYPVQLDKDGVPCVAVPWIEYTQGDGINISENNVITNTGVFDVTTPTSSDTSATNGDIKVIKKVVNNGVTTESVEFVKPKGINDPAFKALDSSTSGLTADDNHVPTSKTVQDAIDTALASASIYKGTIAAFNDLPTSTATVIVRKGWYYRVSTAWAATTGTPATHVGDIIIAEIDSPSKSIDGTNWSLLHNEANTDANVAQSPVSTNANYEVLFSGSADNTAHTEGTGKDSGLTYNPSTNKLTVSGEVSATGFTGDGVKTSFASQTSDLSDKKVPSEKLVKNSLDEKVTGPSSVTGDTIVLFDSTTGKLIKSSSKTFESSYSISDDDNKIPTSKGIRENAATYGKLGTYSADTSRTNITNNTTIKGAVKQLEYREELNKSNILYALNDGVKNLCPINNGSLSDSGYLNENGADGQVLINPIPSGSYKLVWTLSSTATECGFQLILAQGNASVSANRIQTETKYISNTTGTFTADITIPSGKTVTNLVVYMNKAGSASNVMICRADLYNQDSTYVPYALPNYDLTRLESEDRASLAEVVDSGAKNLLDTSTKTIHDMTFTKGSDEYVTVSPNTTDARSWSYTYSQYFVSLNAGKYVLVVDIKTASSDYHTAAVRVYGQTSGELYVSDTLNNKTGTFIMEFTMPKTENCGIMIKQWNGAYRYMLCTKAAFGVSNKFVPYRPNYDLVAQTVAHDIVFKKRSETITTANAWQVYSSLAVTLPVGKTIDITAAAEWSHNSPASEIAIIKGTTVTGTQIIATNAAPSGGQLSLCAHGMYYNSANTDATINVAVKYPSTENNQVSIAYRIF